MAAFCSYIYSAPLLAAFTVTDSIAGQIHPLPSATFGINLFKKCFQIHLVIRLVLLIPCVFVRASIKENYVVNRTIAV